MALVGLHVRQVPNYGRLGMAGFIVGFVGTASSFVTTVIYILSFNRFGTVVDVLQNLGILGWLVGFPLLGIATFRARVFPRWCGVLLAAFAPIFFLVFPCWTAQVRCGHSLAPIGWW